MGRFLTIGIATEFSVSKTRARRESSATDEEIRETLQSCHNQSGIYDLNEDDYRVWLSLNPDIAQKELVDFLQAFYELRYNDHQRQRMVYMPKIKERNTLREWLELAAEKPYQGFQLDEYADCYTPFPKGWKEVLSTDVEQIILSIDGKILMECYYDVFSFFTKILRERLSAFQLADSLMVSISG